MVLQQCAQRKGSGFLLRLRGSPIGLRVHHGVNQRQAWRRSAQSVGAGQRPDHQAIIYRVGEIQRAEEVLGVGGESAARWNRRRLNRESERHARFCQIAEPDSVDRARTRRFQCCLREGIDVRPAEAEGG